MIGLSYLAKNNFSSLKKASVALLANQAAVNYRFEHLADLLIKNKIDLKLIFAPEHGFRGEMQDMDFIGDSKDLYTGVKIVSLYGNDENSLAPKEQDLENIDILLIDLPDIGTRYYTFAQSMIYSMSVAKKTNTKVVAVSYTHLTLPTICSV